MLPSGKVIDYVKSTFSEPYSLRQYNGAPNVYRPPPYMGEMGIEDIPKAEILTSHMERYQKFSECEKRIYRLITWLEQEINLETLIKIKRSAFVSHSEERGSHAYPFFHALPASYQIPGLEALKKHAKIQANE